MTDEANVCPWCGVSVPEGWPSCAQFHASEGTEALRPKMESDQMPDSCKAAIRENVTDI